MASSSSLRSREWRAIIRLVGECRDLGDDPAAWRVHLYAELAALTGAAFGSGGDVTARGGRVTPLGTAEWGWQNGFDRAAFVRAMAAEPVDLTFNPQFAAYFAKLGLAAGEGLTRCDLVADREWVRSEYVQAVHEPIGMGHVLLSFAPTPGGPLSGFALGRPATEQQDFSPRDRLLVRELHAALAPLVGGPLAGYAEPSPADLPPRVRQVLRCLLEGDADKQIATRLGISKHTVNDYTKAVFAHFGVSSRAELAARWIARARGGRP